MHDEPSGSGKGNRNKSTASKANVAIPTEGKGTDEKFVLRSHAYRMELVGMTANPQLVPEKPLPGVVSYFIGNDPSRFGSNCRVYSTVTYRNVYPNIDLRYYSDEGFLKYEFIVQPGGNPAQIVMKYDGVDKLSLSKGELVIKTSVGEVRELPLIPIRLVPKAEQKFHPVMPFGETRFSFNWIPMIKQHH